MDDADYLQERAEYDGRVIDWENRPAVASFVLEIFRDEKGGSFEYLRRSRGFSDYEIFKDWAQGLALGGLFCYWYNRPAVDDLGAILEETEEEKARYTERQAEEMLTRLIYRTLTKYAAEV